VVVADLMEITRQNRDRIQAVHAHALQRREELGGVTQNLRLLRQTYGRVPVGLMPGSRLN